VFSALILQALARDTGQRFHGVDEFAMALVPFARGRRGRSGTLEGRLFVVRDGLAIGPGNEGANGEEGG
jgi:hypothetical protein